MPQMGSGGMLKFRVDRRIHLKGDTWHECSTEFRRNFCLLVLYSAPRSFSPGRVLRFSSLIKNQHFQILIRSWNSRTSTFLNKFLWTPWCSVGKQMTFTFTSDEARSKNEIEKGSKWKRGEGRREWHSFELFHRLFWRKHTNKTVE